LGHLPNESLRTLGEEEVSEKSIGNVRYDVYEATEATNHTIFIRFSFADGHMVL
jgi:hypothetical protein